MQRDVIQPIVPRRVALSIIGGVACSALLNACGGEKATTAANAPYATNAALNAATGAVSPTASGNGTQPTPQAGVTAPAAGTTTAGTAPAGSAPAVTHITGSGPLPKPLPTQGGAPPTIVGVSAASPASGSSVAGSAAPNGSPAPAAQVTITADRAFSPPDVTIRTGQAIQWVNVGRAPQTVTGDPALAGSKQDAALPAGAQPWDSGVLNPGARYTHTFTTPGDYVYFSVPFERQGMVGRITVTG